MPLTVAVDEGRTETTKLLIENGALIAIYRVGLFLLDNLNKPRYHIPFKVYALKQ